MPACILGIERQHFQRHQRFVRTEFKLALLLIVALAATFLIIRQSKHQPEIFSSLPPVGQLSIGNEESTLSPGINEFGASEASVVTSNLIKGVLPQVAAQPTTNKLERLRLIRESFTVLAAGEPTVALRAAKQVTDDTERETALLTLLTEWTHGELGPAQRRARVIAQYGLEAGLAIELANKPDLAILWADELAVGTARVAVYENAAVTMLNTDPAAALALNEKLPELQRRNFLDAVYSTWASADTDAALKWVEQMSDPAEKDAALAAIRTAAPVGIGAVLNMVDGYAVVNGLVSESPAQLSGQLHPGDRIVALAQGDNSFVDAHSLPLEKIVQMVRGAPNTLLQLQVLPADAQPGAAPTTVALYRNQVKFKR